MDTMNLAVTTTEALSVLAGHGYRGTAPRRLVVEAVLRQTRPFSAEQMVAELPGISRATVYRTLEIMASVDLLTRLLQPTGHPAYIVGKPGHRHHLICSHCGYVVAFTACPVEPVVRELTRDTEFAIEGHHLEIFGVCPTCQA